MVSDVFSRLQLRFSLGILLALAVVLLVFIGAMNLYYHASGGSFKEFLSASALFFLVSVVIFSAIAWSLSSWEIRSLREAFDKQRQFIANASHELKTPIAVINANIAVLEHEIPDNKWLGYIKAENARMSRLVTDMLYLAKDDAGRTEYVMKSFDLADAAARSVLPFESVAFEQGTRLEISIPPVCIPVRGDEAKIKQVVVILTDNALKNTERGGLIKISTGTGGNRGYVRVYNSGPGVAAADMKKIFNRFYRVDSSRARSTGGYGLGLSIAQTIAQGHRGKITVESKVGQYAAFTFWLPLGKNDAHTKERD